MHKIAFNLKTVETEGAKGKRNMLTMHNSAPRLAYVRKAEEEVLHFDIKEANVIETGNIPFCIQFDGFH